MIQENILGDCLNVMPELIQNSIKFNLIVADLPYQVTKNSWDTIIPFDILWRNYLDLSNPNTAIILFGQGKFTAKLVLSNETLWKYNLIWNKVLTSGFLNAKKQPLRNHEDIVVFYKKQPTYNPQMEIGEENHSQGYQKGNVKNNKNYGNFKYMGKSNIGNLKYPKSIFTFKRYSSAKMLHPTQKPVDLLEYIIKTYSNENDMILDNTAGVFTTAIAAKINNRNFICIEKDKNYYDMGIKLYNNYNYKIHSKFF